MWDERALDGLDALSFEINPPADDEPGDDEEQAGMSDLIHQLRQRDAAATPGPWRRDETHDGAWGGWDVVTDEWMIALTPDDDDEQASTPKANADLIAEARNALPALLDAAAIVRDLAGLSQVWIDGRPGDSGAWVIACRCTIPEHRPGCPWRRAVEWLGAKGAPHAPALP